MTDDSKSLATVMRNPIMGLTSSGSSNNLECGVSLVLLFENPYEAA